jgi:hypothetical protein
MAVGVFFRSPFGFAASTLLTPAIDFEDGPCPGRKKLKAQSSKPKGSSKLKTPN